MLNKTLLSSAAVILAVVGAQAADLPSKKAAPATYVKICDAYGAGFFYIPGTETCVKLGGYVRAEYNYTPATDTYLMTPALIAKGTAGTGMISETGTVVGGGTNAVSITAPIPAIAAGGAAVAASNATVAIGTGVASAGVLLTPAAMITSTNPVATIYMPKALQDTVGYETRGRIDVDARTPTGYGVARTFVRLRAANTSGIRNTGIGNVLGYSNGTASTTGITIESAMVQWAGFTFGIAPENYAMMPSIMYSGNPWAGFPNGMKQISYTATLGGGFSATLSLEDRNDHAYGSTVIDASNNGAVVVGNVRLDQAWGFGAVHGLWGNANNYTKATTLVDATSVSSGMYFPSGAQTGIQTVNNHSSYAIGATVSFKLPMIATGDQIWFSANYADGFLGALLSAGGLSNLATASNHRLIGGLVRVDQNLGTVDHSTLANVKGWNVNGVMTHYWASQWRSNLSAGYVEINPPTNTANDLVWGKGKVWEIAGSLIYSPAKDFDIGLEVQYAKISNALQNSAATAGNIATYNAVQPGLSASNWATKLRVERSF